MSGKFELIKEMIPSEVKTVFELGPDPERFFSKYYDYAALSIFDEYYKDYMEKEKIDKLNIGKKDIIQDLNTRQKIKLPSNSFDIIIANQVLEHLANHSVIIKEMKRISRRYILIGLPNEITIEDRIRLFFGLLRAGSHGYRLYNHKHFFIVESIEDYILYFFGGYSKKKYAFGVIGGRFIPEKIRKFLADKIPTLFAKEIYYLIDKKADYFTPEQSKAWLK